jgi:hypothetical protein
VTARRSIRRSTYNKPPKRDEPPTPAHALSGKLSHQVSDQGFTGEVAGSGGPVNEGCRARVTGPLAGYVDGFRVPADARGEPGAPPGTALVHDVVLALAVSDRACLASTSTTVAMTTAQVQVRCGGSCAATPSAICRLPTVDVPPHGRRVRYDTRSLWYWAHSQDRLGRYSSADLAC